VFVVVVVSWYCRKCNAAITMAIAIIGAVLGASVRFVIRGLGWAIQL
jgi:hypothetical protein